ncbi:Ig-like domain-containing protein, partial [Gilvibacter sediminis]|uniref:Ig-like domain-containing protein n=2 Tax=Gilvibacter sediminis TaxID=379071 RepID=UPI0023510510
GYTGEDTFEYTICDNGTPALCDTAVVTITINDDNGNITVANDDAYNTTPDTPVTGNVSDNDNDPEGDNQTVNTTPVSGPANGTLVLNADGSFEYTPNPGFEGTDQFVYSVCDDGTPVACDEATVYITVGGILNTTDAIDDINNTFQDTAVSGNVLTNDEDFEGDNQTVTGNTDPANGTVVVNPDGTYTYTPNPGYTGEDSFEYTICDDGTPQACDTATVYIEVLPNSGPENEAPVANADTNTTEVDTPVSGTVLANDYDPDGDPIVVTGNTDPANGTVVVNPDGTYTYTPDPGYTGEDTFEYTICDNGTPALCDTAVVTITINDDNGNITVANDDAYNTTPDTPVTGNVSDNDNDPEGDNQTVNTTPVSGPANGTLVLNADGSFEYTPNPGFEGTDQFVYSVCDDGTPVACDEATVYITVGGTGNEILAIDDINDTFVNTPVSGQVLTNDENPDGPAGTETVTLVTGPSNGTLVLNADGTYTYTPDTDFVGEDTFEYQVCDAGNPVACDTAIVTIEVIDDPILENDPPVANNDTNTTEVDTPVSGTVIANDYDMDGDPIVVTGNTDPANGTVVVNPDGTYTYTPNPGYTGEDTFEYTICDNGTPALCDTAVVTITVTDDNGNITVANDDAYSGEVDTPINGSVLDNDNDPEGDNQTVSTTVVSGPANGTVVINPDGTFTYTPAAGYVGPDQFVYSVCDDGTPIACDEATVYLLVRQTPAPAIALVKTGAFVDGNADGCSDEGEVVAYTFTVTNQGNVPLASVTLTDDLFEAPNPVVPIVLVSGDVNGDNILDLDETWVFEADYALTTADVDAGSITNQAFVAAIDPDGTEVNDLSDDNSVNEDDPTVTGLCQSSSMSVIKNQTSAAGGEGDVITYDIVVTNTGNTTLTNIEITDDNAVITGGNPIAVLLPGESATVTAEHVITQDDIDLGYVENIATALGDSPDGPDTVGDTADTGTDTDGNPIPDPETVETENGDGTTNGDPTDDPTVTTIEQNSSMSVIKNQTSAAGGEGDVITYDIVVTNTGNTTLTNIEITDDNAVITGGNPIAVLLPGESATVTAEHVITQDDIDLGYVENIATALGDSPDGPDTVGDTADTGTDTDGNPIPDPETVETENGDGTTNGDPTDDPTVTTIEQNSSMSVIKNQTSAAGGEGDVITYDIVVTNTGNTTLTNIEITDDNAVITGGNPIAVLLPGESATVTAEHVITQDDIDLGYVENIATALGDSPDGPDTVG